MTWWFRLRRRFASCHNKHCKRKPVLHAEWNAGPYRASFWSCEPCAHYWPAWAEWKKVR